MNLNGWPEHDGWAPDDATRIALEQLADVARYEIELQLHSDSPAYWSDSTRDQIRAIARRLERAGLPADLADAALTAWIHMRHLWSVADCVAFVVQPIPTNSYLL